MEKIYKVLWWADFKRSYSNRIIEKLKELCPNYEFDVIEAIWNINNEEYALKNYDIVILQSTDVTKFSAEESEREKIGEYLDDFVDDGKKLIVSHDVIYRRTRNTHLQEMFNYRINNFERLNAVKYFKTSFCKKCRAFSSLESSFRLSDGEICWGDDKTDDKKVFFETDLTDKDGNNLMVPLVFGKIYNGGGQLIWFNTGDTINQPPQPITDRDENFIKLLAECIKIDLNELKPDLPDGKQILTRLHACDFSKPFSFISYSSGNAARVYEICLFLDMLGVNYFLDTKNITSSVPGSDGWRSEVKAALNHENCKSAFVFLSEDYLDSPQCYFEVGLMDTMNFVPIFLGVSVDNERIISIIKARTSLQTADKINTLKHFLAIHKSPETNEYKIGQLVFHCYRDLRQFKNIQLMNTVDKNCNLSEDAAKKIFDDDAIDALISECKQITKLS